MRRMAHRRLSTIKASSGDNYRTARRSAAYEEYPSLGIGVDWPSWDDEWYMIIPIEVYRSIIDVKDELNDIARDIEFGKVDNSDTFRTVDELKMKLVGLARKLESTADEL